MDLKISYNWIKEYTGAKVKPEVFAREFSLKSQTIDRIHSFKPSFKNVITVKILEVNSHPNADKLKLAKVTDGKNEFDVVCGAPNIAPGQIVPFATVGAVLRSEEEEFSISRQTIRGVESNGMLCSAKELQLGSDHSGIMILPENTRLGVSFEKVFPFDDEVLDIEVTSNRPDAMSVVGLAREAAAVFGKKFNLKTPRVTIPKKSEKPFSVVVKDTKNCERYQAVVITNIEVKPSPLWMQQRLILSGLKPINNIVDITNYILLECGQPLHAFDYEKLEGHKIIVRRASKKEKIVALDEVEYSLDASDLVISDNKSPVAIAGIMGGLNSSINNETKTIVFEAANFKPLTVRKTSRKLNLFSQASSLFEKGLHPEALNFAMMRAIELTQKIAGGRVISPIIDINEKKFVPKKVKFNVETVQRLLSVNISISEVKKILELLGFNVSGNKTMLVSVPWWRDKDIEHEHDIIEEIARIYGYENLPMLSPSGQIPVADFDPVLYWEKHARNYLSGIGFTEVYNYSMVSKKIFEKANRSVQDALSISNPLSEDMVYMRTSLIPQIAQTVSDNSPRFGKQKVYELGRIYLPVGEAELPEEMPRLCGAVYGYDNLFFEAKGVVESLLLNMGIEDCRFDQFSSHIFSQLLNIFKDNRSLGRVGIVKGDVLKNFGIPKELAVFDLDFVAIAETAKKEKIFTPIAEFPAVSRDFSIIIDRKVQWQDVRFLLKKIDDTIEDVIYLDTFVSGDIGNDKKSLSLRVVFRSKERTLTSQEADMLSEKVVKALKQKWEVFIR